ncbi:MAG: putative metal-binding motif-containing protein, partial [bacterium]|nr:putative metal-binding motif-containing protein [bacterium]
MLFRLFAVLATFLVVCLGTNSVALAGTTYTDQATWESALGATTQSENFTTSLAAYSTGTYVPNDGVVFAGFTTSSTDAYQNGAGSCPCEGVAYVWAGSICADPSKNATDPTTLTITLDAESTGIFLTYFQVGYAVTVEALDSSDVVIDSYVIPVQADQNVHEDWGMIWTGSVAKITFQTHSDHNVCFDVVTTVVDSDSDLYAEDVDCDDATSTTYPGAFELCDGIDNDCDVDIDEDFIGTSCYDDDGDTFSEDDGDCDDGNSSTY